MSSHNHSPWLTCVGACQNTVDDTASPHISPMHLQDHNSLNSNHERAILASWLGNDNSNLGGAQLSLHENEVVGKNNQTLFQNDPTLAPEPSLEDFDLSAILHTPCDLLYPPQTLQTLASPAQDIAECARALVLPPGTTLPDTRGPWDNTTSGEWENMQDLWDLSANVPLNSRGDYSDMDAAFNSMHQGTDYAGAPIQPLLPELPASMGTQFEFSDDLQAYAMESVSPIEQYREMASLGAPYQPVSYPDPVTFNPPYPSTPGLTSSSTTPSKQSRSRTAQRDTSMDSRLVELRRQGKSYKQIKETLGLEEAESTLRGRYRTLTKPKEARVRKPEWSRHDIRILSDSVIRASNSNPIALGAWVGLNANAVHQFANKVPWKQVAEWMEEQGTYRYGNATVKKKYLAEMKRKGAPI